MLGNDPVQVLGIVPSIVPESKPQLELPNVKKS